MQAKNNWRVARALILEEFKDHAKKCWVEMWQGAVAFFVLLGTPFFYGFSYLRAKHQLKNR